MLLLRSGTRYEAKCAYEDRHVLKAAGFQWDPQAKAWWTAEEACVARLRGLVSAPVEIHESAVQAELVIPSSWDGHASCAVDGPLDIPCPPGLAYLPYQRGGIAYARGKNGVLIADEPGLGKTIQAIGILNDEPVKTVLIICPASIKENWRREVDKWLNYYLPIHVVEKAAHPLPGKIGVLIVNYDIVAKLRPRLDGVAWDALICDESHLTKSLTAKRTVAILGGAGKAGIRADKRIFLTGTPAESRPAELFSVCHALRPDLFPSWLDFAFRYCGAYQSKYGLDARGATHVGELQAILREHFMVRRKKMDVLKDLPPKVRVRVTLPCDKKLRASVDAELAAYQRERALIESLKQRGASVEDVLLAKNAAQARMRDLRVATSEGKMPMALEFIRNAAAQEKVVIFCKHHAVLDVLVREFGGRAVCISGKTPTHERMALVDRFQNDPECAAFIGQIDAAGVGLTLTAASHVIFVEYDWRPGVLEQASDRCHRIGQTDSVTCSYLVIEDSLDDVMLSSINKKRDTLHETLDIPTRQCLQPAASLPDA
jgi:SWI/SNF-related matrix-associated actin-dependent regulator of chromatin subfamily A-like protein 1